MTLKIKGLSEDATIAQDSLHPAARSVDDPKSKVEVISKAVGHMASMSKEDLVKWYTSSIDQIGHEADGAPDAAAANRASVSMKPSDAVAEDVAALFDGETLTEEFKHRTATLFEAAVNLRLTTETVRLEEEFEARLEEAVDEIAGALAGKVDQYMEYVVEAWLEQNALVLESTIETDVVHSFMEGLKSLFTEHYIEVPEAKRDVVAELEDQVEALTAKLNEALDDVVEGREILTSVARDAAIAEAAVGLTLVDAEKMHSLCEGLDFTDDFDDKLKTVRETYFKEGKQAKAHGRIDLNEGVEPGAELPAVDPRVARYVTAMSKGA